MDPRPDADSPEDSARRHRAEDARGGEIILRTPARRAVFIAGLVGLVIVAVLVRLAGGG